MLINLDELINPNAQHENDLPKLIAAWQERTVFFTSDGKWSLHDLVEEALRVVGPSAIYIATFSITEFPARRLCTLIDEGLITSLHLLIDIQFPNRYPNVHQFLQGMGAKLGYTAVHAKFIVIESAAGKMLMALGSANWTVNPRLEAGVVTPNEVVSASFKQKILSLCN